MPNWCLNVLTVRGEPEMVAKFIQESAGRSPAYGDDSVEDEDEPIQPLAFNAQVPPPREVLQAGYSDAGYEWQIEHWGTKREAEDVELKREGDTAIYEFLSAFVPPIAWLRTVSGLYPALVFHLEYEEPGWDVEGRLRVKDGKAIDLFGEVIADSEDAWGVTYRV